MEDYVALLLEWNRKVNLISRKAEGEIWENHILHSISPLFKVRLKPATRIMDLGTGGGMPGIPMKIILPDLEFLLVDSTRKKIAAVQDILVRLNLGRIAAVWGRAEELGREENLVSHFDYIVARAVAPLKDLIDWSSPFLRHPDRTVESPAGENSILQTPALIALKGGDLEDEVSKARRAKATRSIDVLNLVFPGSEEISSAEKKIVIVKF